MGVSVEQRWFRRNGRYIVLGLLGAIAGSFPVYLWSVERYTDCAFRFGREVCTTDWAFVANFTVAGGLIGVMLGTLLGKALREHYRFMRRGGHDLGLWLSGYLGAFVGGVVSYYWAVDRHTSCARCDTDWLPVVLFTLVGIIVAAFLGVAALELLRVLIRMSRSTN